MIKYFKFIKGVLKHKYYVFVEMCGYGLYVQGLLHDMSKFSITELKQAKYYTGVCSPINLEKQDKGYSMAWLHHIHHNKHHWEFWCDPKDGKVAPIEDKYIKEMVCDIIGASKAYLGRDFTPQAPVRYVRESGSHPEWLKKILIPRLEEKLGLKK